MKVNALMQDNTSREDMLFNPVGLDKQMMVIQANPCLVAPGSDGMMVIAVENHNYHPVELGEGQLLGLLESVSTLSALSEIRTLEPAESPDLTRNRTSEVLQQLDIEASLEEDRKKALLNTVDEFAEVFAPFALRKRTEQLIDKMLTEGVQTAHGPAL